MTQWLSPMQAAKLSGVASAPVFRHWAREGMIAAIRLPNGRYKINRAAVEKLTTPEPKQASPVDPKQLTLLDEAVVR